jgi:hypothetical protein
MEFDSEEPSLPYTPSNTGRKARVGYLGFDGVGFNDLWPLFAGLILSLGLGLKFFVGDGIEGGHWLWRTVVALSPFATGFCYLRLLVVGRPPHFKADLWSTALDLRLDFTHPACMAVPILPRIVLNATAACGPERAANLSHPRTARSSASLKP